MDNLEKIADNNVPYIVFESTQSRAERHTKRLWIALIIVTILAIVSLAVTNLAWLNYVSQYEVETYDYMLDTDGGDGDNNFIGRDGDIYGKNENPPSSAEEKENSE